LDGIDLQSGFRHDRRVHFDCSMMILFQPSRRAVQPGRTTVVVSYSSMISGPSTGLAVRATRGMSRVSSHPSSAPKYARRIPAFAIDSCARDTRAGTRDDLGIPRPTTFSDTNWRGS